jgi:hypothetical protein
MTAAMKPRARLARSPRHANSQPHSGEAFRGLPYLPPLRDPCGRGLRSARDSRLGRPSFGASRHLLPREREKGKPFQSNAPGGKARRAAVSQFEIHFFSMITRPVRSTTRLASADNCNVRSSG